jgi:uncharacterized caspase-like protein
MRLFCFLAAFSVVLASGSSTALAQSRVALVIGNAAYQFNPPLKNSVNDARLVGATLRSVGFEVTTASNLNRADLDRVLRQFLGAVAGKGKDVVVFVFYAGQGVEIAGENFMLPVDIRIQREADVLAEGLSLSTLLSSLSLLPAATRIVVFDTSRSNPFPSANRAAGTVDVPAGSLVAFSTSPGTEASEGAGANSPYAVALAEVIKERGVPIDQAFKKLREKVSSATSGQQVPQETSTLATPFAF